MFRSIAIAAYIAAMWSSTSLAQVTAEFPTPKNTRVPTPAQRDWLSVSPERRAKISEQIGEDGARSMAKANGYEVLFDGLGKSLPQGPDQVYRAADGRVIVYEAKGGSGQLGHAYGYPQGSTEWSVESAKRVFRSPQASSKEKSAAKEVLEAAANGKLEVHVTRTSHILGEPVPAVLEKVTSTTDDASRLARTALDDLASVASKVAGNMATVGNQGNKSTTTVVDDAARVVEHAKRVRSASKALVVVGVAVDAGSRAKDVVEVERRFAAGELTQQNRELQHAKNAAGFVGGWGGAAIGAKGGALAGSAAGGPIGAAVGGVAGGIGGYYFGEEAATAAIESAVDAVHRTGTTLVDYGDSAWNSTSNSASRAWSWVRGR